MERVRKGLKTVVTERPGESLILVRSGFHSMTEPQGNNLRRNLRYFVLFSKIGTN